MDKKEIVELLMKLSDLFGVAGDEGEVREFIIKYLKELGYPYRVDRRGNVVAEKRGKGEYKVLLDAHIDEVGFMVAYINEKGFIKPIPVGGIDERTLANHIVKFRTEKGYIEGVFSTLPPHVLTAEEKKEPLTLERLYIDIGAANKEEVYEKGIKEGTFGVIHYPARYLNGDTVMGKAFDDRTGTAILLALAKDFKDREFPFDLYFAFAVQEERGLRGAWVIREMYKPDIALIFEGTLATDLPYVPEEKIVSRLGKGPVLTIMDRSVVVSPSLRRFIEKIAEENDISFQYKFPKIGGTNGGIYALGNTDVAIISTPVRNIHGPVGLLKVKDFYNTYQLGRAVIENLYKYLN